MYVNSVCLCMIEAWNIKYIGTNLGQTLKSIESKNYFLFLLHILFVL